MIAASPARNAARSAATVRIGSPTRAKNSATSHAVGTTKSSPASSTRISAANLPRDRRRLRAWLCPPLRRQTVGRSPGNQAGKNGRSTPMTPKPSTSRLKPSPSIKVMTRSTSGNTENGASRSMAAVAKRQSKCEGVASFGAKAMSHDTPAPFIQRPMTKSVSRMISNADKRVS